MHNNIYLYICQMLTFFKSKGLNKKKKRIEKLKKNIYNKNKKTTFRYK